MQATVSYSCCLQSIVLCKSQRPSHVYVISSQEKAINIYLTTKYSVKTVHPFSLLQLPFCSGDLLSVFFRFYSTGIFFFSSSVFEVGCIFYTFSSLRSGLWPLASTLWIHLWVFFRSEARVVLDCLLSFKD